MTVNFYGLTKIDFRLSENALWDACVAQWLKIIEKILQAKHQKTRKLYLRSLQIKMVVKDSIGIDKLTDKSLFEFEIKPSKNQFCFFKYTRFSITMLFIRIFMIRIIQFTKSIRILLSLSSQICVLFISSCRMSIMGNRRTDISSFSKSVIFIQSGRSSPKII